MTINGYDRYSSPLLIDLEGDGKQEIIVGTDSGVLTAARYDNGSFTKLWETNLGASLGSSAAAADLDGDGNIEIVIGVGWAPLDQRGRIVILNSRGQLRCERGTLDRNAGPNGIPDGVFSTPALGDLNNDGRLEVVVAGYDEELYVLDANCKDFVPSGSQGVWPRHLRDNTWGSPTLADMNDDGYLDIVVGYYMHDSPCPDAGCGLLSVFDYKGNHLPGWPLLVDTHLDSSPAVGDIDNDGKLEIVIGTGQNNLPRFHKIYALRANGTSMPGWPKSTGGFVWASPSLADVDGDGDLEIFVAAADGKLYGLNHTGGNLPNWPVSIIDQNGYLWPSTTASSPTIVDVDGDRIPEVFIAAGWDIVGYKVTGAPMDSNRLKTDYSIGSTPAWGDFDNDGQLEVTIAGGHYSEIPRGVGRLYVWEFGQPYNAAASPWPMWRRDSQRMGTTVTTPAKIVVQDTNVTLFKAIDSSSSASMDLWLEKEGPGTVYWSSSSSSSRLTTSPSSGTLSTGSIAIQVTVNTAGLPSGMVDLGSLSIRTTSDNGPATSSSITVRAFNGPVKRVRLPAIMFR